MTDQNNQSKKKIKSGATSLYMHHGQVNTFLSTLFQLSKFCLMIDPKILEKR